MSKEQGSESAVSGSQFIKKEEEMAEEKEAPKRVSRRQFVKGAAVGGAGVAAAGMLASCAPAPVPTTAPGETAAPAPTCPPAGECAPCPVPGVPEAWDKEADVIVVGFGGAGASTAIAAHDAGAKVLILEKAPEGEEGGNTRVSGNLWFNPAPADKAITYLNAMAAGYPIPQDMVRVWAEEMGKNADWVRSLGGTPYAPEPQSAFCSPEFPELPGAECSTTYFNEEGGWGQSRLWKLLQASVEERGIEVLYGTPAKELIQNAVTKEILGVIAETEGETIYIKAKKAVALTCGGFENNQQMIRDFLSRPQMAQMGTPYNTGDGITMAQRVGAALWHMDAQAGMGLDFQVPGTTNVVSVSPGSNNWIRIDGNGVRFANEKMEVRHGYAYLNGVWLPQPTPVPAHLIFDETVRIARPLSIAHLYQALWVMVMGLEWSEDNSEEIAKGWIIKADTVSELATKIEVDAGALEATVNKYNGYCDTGIDADFGRPKEGLAPIATAPYYAVPLVPALLNTQGGPKRNPDARILDTEDKPIPRLYSAGELGSMYSFLYNGGGNVGETMAFGRVAGRNAAAEEAWA